MIRITKRPDVSYHVHVTSPTYVDYVNNAPECFLHTLLHSLSIYRGSIITIQVRGCNIPIEIKYPLAMYMTEKSIAHLPIKIDICRIFTKCEECIEIIQQVAG